MSDIINNYGALPIGGWLRIQRIVRDEQLEEIDKQVRTIAELSGLTPDEVLRLPIADYKKGVAAAEFLTHPIEEDRRRRPAKVYRLAGLELAVQDMEKMTTAQYIDAQTFMDQGEDGIIPLLSVFLVPKGHPYGEGYDVQQVQQAVADHLSTEAVFDLAAFFLRRSARSMIRTLRSLGRAKASRERTAKIRAEAARLKEILLRLS